MRDIARLVGRYEGLTLMGRSTTSTVISIYSELLEDGCICDEMQNVDFVMDLLLIGLEYEFADEEILERLAMDIVLTAIADSLPEGTLQDLAKAIMSMVDTEEDKSSLKEPFEVDEETIEDDIVYIVTRTSIDVDMADKGTSVVNKVFYSIDDITEYINDIGMTLAVNNAITSFDLDTGHTEMLATEDAIDALDELGVDGMLIADQIPDGAVGVMAIITTNREHDCIRYAEVFSVFEATEYEF